MLTCIHYDYVSIPARPSIVNHPSIGRRRAAMHDQTSLLAPLCVFLVRRGGSGDRILFRYPFADPKTGVQFELLFRIDKTSLRVSRIVVATPWDDCPYTKSNDDTFVHARGCRVFLTSYVGKPYTNLPLSSIVTLKQSGDNGCGLRVEMKGTGSGANNGRGRRSV